MNGMNGSPTEHVTVANNLERAIVLEMRELGRLSCSERREDEIWPLCNAIGIRTSNGCLACLARDRATRGVYIASKNFAHLCNEGQAEVSATCIT